MSLSGRAERANVELVGMNPQRARPAVRQLHARELLEPRDLTAPLLVLDAPGEKGRLPGAVPLNEVAQTVQRWASLGIRGIKIFVAGGARNATASGALQSDNLMMQAISEAKAAADDVVVTTEVCGCSWTDHGECALLLADGKLDLPSTYDLMASMALMHASVGADVVSPTAMLDGSVQVIRAALNEDGQRDVGVGPNIAIHSVLYGPFKTLMATNPGRGHRKGLQLEQQNAQRTAIAQADRWLSEGADFLTLQPVMTAIDVLVALRAHVVTPITAYSTSGEYAALAAMGREASLEYHRALKRSGADLILTYAAEELAQTLQ